MVFYIPKLLFACIDLIKKFGLFYLGSSGFSISPIPVEAVIVINDDLVYFKL